MRPRLGGRGSCPYLVQVRCQRSRFNEAPAWWPGKSAPVELAQVPILGGFNEAPAWWPGKCSIRARRRHAPRVASMRPRLGGRGSALPCPAAPPCPTSFNEAPAWWPGKWRSGTASWQRSWACFNEAPAWWPGKSAGRRGGARSRSRFNEAPAWWPGKSTEPQVGVAPRFWGRLASGGCCAPAAPA